MSELTPLSSLTNQLLLDWRTTTSCDYHRIVLPFTYSMPKPKVPVFVFNRVVSNGAEFIKELKKEGVKIVMDIDDHYELDINHYLFESFKSSGMTERLINNIKMADVVTVTTPLLASKIRHLNSNIVVIPNALPFDADQFTLSKDKESDTSIVWCGGASHYGDLRMLANLNIESLTIAENITLAGYNSENDQWKKIKKANPKMKYKVEKPLQKYMDSYDGHMISIAPLEDNFFNACKSNLKVLESGAKGLPIICSPVEPYYNSVDKDVVLYAEDLDDWFGLMTKLLISKSYREDMGNKLAEHVRLHYQLSDANELRRQVIESFS